MLTAALTTAATSSWMSASALTRSRSVWSMTAMSPGCSRLARFLVRLSIRAVAEMPGRLTGLFRRNPGSLRKAALIAKQSCQMTGTGTSASAPPGLSSGPRGPLGRRGFQQLTGVQPAELGILEARQHPGQLAHPALLVQAGHAAAGDRAVAGLLHHQVVVRERGHLGQVGDDDNLREPGQPGQPAADLDRRLAAHARVDLVEDEGRHRVRAGEYHLNGKHDPGQLPA